MKRLIILGLVSCVTIFTVYAGSSSVDLGGDNTVYDPSEGAFEHPLPLLNADELERFEQGDDLFATEFTPQTGLGPIFNATSCEGCHAADGRGRPPSFTGETSTGLLIRLALDRPSRDGSIEPDPVYGGQFQDVGTGRTRQEGTLSITYRELHGTYADGTAYTLYAPNYQLADLQYGRLRPEITFSPRLAGQMIGLGLLEAVPETDLLTLTDPDDRNGDGISGRANYVWDTTENRYAIGRFGWKANQPSLLQQTAAAFNGDIGITSSFADQQPCTDRERQCDDALRNPPRNDPQRNAPPPPQNPLSLGALLPPPRNESGTAQTRRYPRQPDLRDQRRYGADGRLLFRLTGGPGAAQRRRSASNARTGDLRTGGVHILSRQRAAHRDRSRRSPRSATRRSTRTPIYCCTTWARVWRMVR